ncbi:MAG: glutathione S-transferase [Myxococcota bacterium]|jgi:glutathione S-transferase
MAMTLTYFDFDASRGLECRLALTAAGLPFEDIRIKRPQWMALKPTVPFGALPVFTDGEKTLSQTDAILRYVGVQNGLHPTDPWTAALHDALMMSVEDLRNKVPGRGLSEDEKKTAREAFAQGWLTQWADTISDNITGPFIAGAALNVVDIKLYVVLRAYLSGGYDYIPASFFDAWPSLLALYAVVDAHPAVQGWFAD